MNPKERRSYLSELATLERMIESLSDEDVIERVGFQNRMEDIKDILSKETFYEPTNVQVAFQGRPIITNYGADADFVTTALNKFVKVITTIDASKHSSLGARGALPKSDNYRLIVTGIVRGSFGFELEEIRDETTMSPVKTAMDQAIGIMKSAVESKEILEDVIKDVDFRVVKSIREFLDVMIKNDALCTFETEDTEFKFANNDQIQLANNNLKQNILEEEKELVGMFRGVLPSRKQFEFYIEENSEIIVGKGSPEFEDMSKLNDVIGIPVKIQVKIKPMGKGQSYTLLNYK